MREEERGREEEGEEFFHFAYSQHYLSKWPFSFSAYRALQRTRFALSKVITFKSSLNAHFYIISTDPNILLEDSATIFANAQKLLGNNLQGITMREDTAEMAQAYPPVKTLKMGWGMFFQLIPFLNAKFTTESLKLMYFKGFQCNQVVSGRIFVQA